MMGIGELFCSVNPDNILSCLNIIDFMPRKDVVTGLIQSCTTVHDLYSDHAYSIEFGPMDIGMGPTLIEKLIGRKNFRINAPGNRKTNLVKYIIWSDYAGVLHFVDKHKPGFRWNERMFTYLRYAIKHDKIDAVNFLLTKIKHPKSVGTRSKNMIIEDAKKGKNEDLIHDIFTHFGVVIPRELFSVKHMISRGMFTSAITKIKQADDSFRLRKDHAEEILDVLVESELHGRHEVAKMIIGVYGGDHIGETPLLRAMRKGDVEMSKLLMFSGKFDLTVLDNKMVVIACQNGWIDVVMFMVKHGKADPSARENSCIVEAARRGHTKLVKLLMTHKKVDPSVDDNYALDEAERNGHDNIVKLLMTDSRVYE